MKDIFVLAAIILVALLLPLTVLAARSPAIDGFVALQTAGILMTLALVCLAVGLESTAASGIALLAGILTWATGLIFARFLDRQP